MALRAEYRPVIRALQKVYAIREEHDRLANKDPVAAKRKMKTIFETEFSKIEERIGQPVVVQAKGLAFHLSSEPPEGRHLHDVQLEFHGYERHNQVGPNYGLHYYETLADIAAALAISKIRSDRVSKSKRGKKGQVPKRLTPTGTSLYDIMNRVVQREGRKPGLHSEFNLLAAVARSTINEFMGQSASPEKIAFVPNSTHKADLVRTGYRAAIQRLRE